MWLYCTVGVGTLKPHVQMFDPGWRIQVNGSSDVPREDKGTIDGGNDPQGVLERCAFKYTAPFWSDFNGHTRATP